MGCLRTALKWTPYCYSIVKNPPFCLKLAINEKPHGLSAGLERVREAYLPFWVTTAELSSHLASAELGFQEWVYAFNPQRRRFEQQLVTTWRPAAFDVVGLYNPGAYTRSSPLGVLGKTCVRRPPAFDTCESSELRPNPVRQAAAAICLSGL